jgi:hypothetical protein
MVTALSAAERKPDAFMIVADGLGAGERGCQGFADYTNVIGFFECW